MQFGKEHGAEMVGALDFEFYARGRRKGNAITYLVHLLLMFGNRVGSLGKREFALIINPNAKDYKRQS